HPFDLKWLTITVKDVLPDAGRNVCTSGGRSNTGSCDDRAAPTGVTFPGLWISATWIASAPGRWCLTHSYVPAPVARVSTSTCAPTSRGPCFTRLIRPPSLASWPFSHADVV